ncbi:cytochrome c oxidase subunit II [Parasphingopyxis sp. CP4]|uniref:cytochrome c oxidase subunit II n=1 Tax=Parasphingopyxis sp. CP4 TaxID=2724527 RepID=UPI0015A18384|nr:cytochrome c oxidase subunit II [Parasphingopyxis sp. CP4]QLC22315.1 cytochrome c oxidase subunit II [Parasphingopyxis sp. CP4]
MHILKTLTLAAGLAVASLSVTSAASAAAPQPDLAPAPQAELAPAPGAEGDVAESVAAETPAFDYAAPDPEIGQPTGGMGLPVQVTEIGQDARWFHDALLMPIITVISLLVLFLLLWVMARYNRRTNPNPSKTTHNTTLEVIWTLVPVLILVFIAVPSIGLLQAQYDLPEGETVTVKVTGNQWNWTYEYPDHGDILLVSNMLEEEGEQQEGARFRTDQDGPRLLAVDERLVIPSGTNVRFLITASDVLHSFAVPAFWLKMDAVPGRLNETWTRVDREGVYFGQCSELCGARHGFMPIAVEVVSPEEFEQWVALQGGTMPGDEAAAEDGAEDASADDETETADDAAEIAVADTAATAS